MKEKSKIEKNAEERQISLLSTALGEASKANGYWLNASGKRYPRLYPHGVSASPFNALFMALHSLLGAKLKKRIAVITDNDNLNIEKLETKRNLPQEEVVRLFTEKDTSLHTLEPAFVNANVDNLKGLSKLIRGENVDKESAESLSEYMKKHKTEWALKLLEDESYNFNVPQYIMDAINWLIDGEK